MKPNFLSSRQRGSVILMAILAITIITAIAISILGYSSFSYRSAERKLRLRQLTLAANNDMEYLFYRWSNSFTKPLGNSIEQQLAQNNPVLVDTHVDANPSAMLTDSSLSSPSLSATTVDYNVHQVFPMLNSLNVNRSLVDANIPAQGQVIGASGLPRTGNVKYWTVKTRVWMKDPILGTIEARVGRRFTYQAVSSCNGAIYYQGDLEFGAGSTMDIYGDIQSNGSIFMGSSAGTLTVHDKVYNLNGLNGSLNPTTVGTQYSILSSRSGLYTAPVFSTSVAAQATQLTAPDNMLGLDTSGPNSPQGLASARPDLYPNGVNDIYRAVIAPPPTDGSGNPVTENQTISDSRMYNKAGLIITVGTGGVVTVVDPLTGTDPSNGAISSSITAVRQQLYDAREQKVVNMTTIDVSQLTDAINNAQNPANNPSGWTFNGILYVYDNNPSATAVNGKPDLNGIRLKNANQTPNFPTSSTDPRAAYLPDTGFTIASDNGVYVQGNFNTVVNTDTNKVNRTAIMGDAVTVLSQDWNDANSEVDPLTHAVVAGSVVPTQPNYRGSVTSDLTINSAIMTGNTPTVVAGSNPATQTYAMDSSNNPIVSGGVQNLVRYLEDWYYHGKNTTINGSIAQLFSSKYFNSHYYTTGGGPGQPNVYNAPTNRQMKFNFDLASNPPAGIPSSLVKYYRGDLFQW